MKDAKTHTVAPANKVPQFIQESHTLQMRVFESRLIFQPVTNQPVKAQCGTTKSMPATHPMSCRQTKKLKAIKVEPSQVSRKCQASLLTLVD
jgi:hypothetical protein